MTTHATDTALLHRIQADYRAKLLRENIRAAYLRAKHRVITARLEQGRKQLELPLKEVA